LYLKILHNTSVFERHLNDFCPNGKQSLEVELFGHVEPIVVAEVFVLERHCTNLLEGIQCNARDALQKPSLRSFLLGLIWVISFRQNVQKLVWKALNLVQESLSFDHGEFRRDLRAIHVLKIDFTTCVVTTGDDFLVPVEGLFTFVFAVRVRIGISG